MSGNLLFFDYLKAENRQIIAEQQFKNEMISLKKLADLYQSKSQALAAHNQELEQLVRDLEAKLVESTDTCNRITNEKANSENVMKEALDAKELELEKLRAELSTINGELMVNAQADQVYPLFSC